jgi:UDP-N-acetylglucosamine:LPS N-acetylglucosamine transferase
MTRSPRAPARTELSAPRLLLLTSGLGSGHVRAAEAVSAAARLQVPNAVVQTIDVWSLINPGVAAFVQQLYLQLVQERPDLYARLYQLPESTWRATVLNRSIALPPAVAELIERIVANRNTMRMASYVLGSYPTDLLLFPAAIAALPDAGSMQRGNSAALGLGLLKWLWGRLERRMEQLLLDFAPDAVICTQMIPAALVSKVKGRLDRPPVCVGVLTDFGAHEFWLQQGTDAYCVGHESMIAAPFGPAQAGRVVATGVPLMPGFSDPPPVADCRRSLGLDPQAPLVVVLGGGLGLGVDAVARTLLERLPSLQVIVMTGRNASARAALAPVVTRHGRRLLVCEWTNSIERMLRAADIVVGKPGGLTVAEVLACGRPLLATRALRGQEGFNVRFLEQHGVGELVDEDALPAQIEAWLAEPAQLADRQGRAWRLGRRDGAGGVIDLALDLAERAATAELAQEA